MTQAQKRAYEQKLKSKKALIESLANNAEKILLLAIILSPLFLNSLKKLSAIGFVSLTSSGVLFFKVRYLQLILRQYSSYECSTKERATHHTFSQPGLLSSFGI